MEEVNINLYRHHLKSFVEKKFGAIEDDNILEGISVITCTNRKSKMNYLFDNFLRQNYELKELIIILNNNDMSFEEYREKAEPYDNIKVFQLDEKLTLGECFIYGIEHASFDYIAKFDDDDYYGRNYLKQAMETFKKVPCDIIGKASYYIYFHESKTLALYAEQKQNMFINRVTDSSLVFKRHVFDNVEIPIMKKAGTFAQFQTRLVEHGMKIYSTDCYHYLVNRYSDRDHNHTWKISDERYLKYKLTKIVEENSDDFLSYIEKE